MSIISADTNLFLYAANPSSPWHDLAKRFFSKHASKETNFVVCELVLVELYMLMRNPAVLKRPLDSANASAFCQQIRANPNWQHIDYEPSVSTSLWEWAGTTTSGFRRIIDARLALTLRHHGIERFATANTKDFMEFDFKEVWNPLV